MISQQICDALKANWPLAESMQCKTLIRIIDPNQSWACYIYAMDPQNEDTVMCISEKQSRIIRHVFTSEMSLNTIQNAYNQFGEYPIIDTEFRPQWTFHLFKKLQSRAT